MLLIVDAQVFFASLIRRGYTLSLIRLLHEKGYELVVPEYIFEEVARKEEKLLKYSKLEKGKLWYTLFLAMSNIKTVPVGEYAEYLEEAGAFSPLEDIPYAALALKYRSERRKAAIWSNDSGFKNAAKGMIEILSTQEIKRLIGLA
jgi:predicted nucleic acid-binding protein